MSNGTVQIPFTLAEKLGNVRVSVREDLEVSRHLFRGEVSYIVRDPVTFQSQRLSPADYTVLIAIDASRSLSEVFENLVARKKVSESERTGFFEFVTVLHRLGFLHLPVSDSKALYRRHEIKEKASRRQKALGFLFFRIPLWNPNDFLNRTIRYARFLFSRWFFALWLLLMLAVTYVLISNRHELARPLQGLLAARNLALIWVTLIVLKVFHEFGHAYACKHFGGHVPEMGAYIILFTPCAYMDATASWGFTRRRDRLIVCLAGMYVESMIAGLAVFVWAATGPSLLNSLAYNVIFLAGTVTVLFNINPLMRYDGYYMASDLTEIPNLRARSMQYVLDVGKRLCFGRRAHRPVIGRRLRLTLLSYGVAAIIYRTGLILAIAAILASKMFILGMAMAAFYVGAVVLRAVKRLIAYLWYAQETAAVRVRAVCISVLMLLILPAVLAIVPVPTHVYARGLLIRENETVVRAQTDGFVQQLAVEPGQIVRPGTRMADLADDRLLETVAKARADLKGATIRRDAYQVTEPDRAQQESHRVKAYRAALDATLARLTDLHITAPVAGNVVSALRHKDVGRFVPEGTPVATIVSGKWQVCVMLTEDQVAQTRPRPGDRVSFRPAGHASAILEGTIEKVAPGGSRAVPYAAFTHLGGGSIAVDAQTGMAARPYFELVVTLDPVADETSRYGMTGTARLDGVAEPILTRASRSLVRFVNRLMRD